MKQNELYFGVSPMLPRQDSHMMVTGTCDCRCNGVGHCWQGQLLHAGITVSSTNRAILTGCIRRVQGAHTHEGVSGTLVP